MNYSEKLNTLESIDPEIPIYDGLEDALVGYCDICNKTIAIFDKDKAIQVLMDNNNWTEEESIEYFDFNILGSYIGELTPGFITYF